MTDKIKGEKMQWVNLLIEELSLQCRSPDMKNKAQVTQLFMRADLPRELKHSTPITPTVDL